MVLDRTAQLKEKFKKICAEKEIDISPIAEGTYIRMYGGLAPDPSDDMYRNIPAYSNSRINDLEKELQGIGRGNRPFAAFEFGKIFHQQLLEPELCKLEDYYLPPAKLRDMKGMIASVKDSEYGELLADSQNQNDRPLYEQIVIWNDRLTKLPCKAKIDLQTGVHIYDLKTTRAHSQEMFEAMAERYRYDRQAAFYLDGSRAKVFVLVAVQKQAPYQVFTVSYTKRMKAIDKARRQYRFVLGKVGEGRW